MKTLKILFAPLIFLAFTASISAQPCDPPESPYCPTGNYAEYQAYCGVPVEMFGYNWDIDHFYTCGEYSDIVVAYISATHHTEMTNMPTYWKGQTSYGDWFIEGTPDLEAGYSSGYYLYAVCIIRVYPGWNCSYSWFDVRIEVE